MIKSILKRLRGASGAGARQTVRAGTKQTVRSARQTARTRAARAAKTTVQTAPAARKVGTKAVLNGKEVYWGGKDFGWQSKSSLTNITGKKPKARATGKPQKPKHATPPPKKGDAPKGTRDAANGTKTIAARGRSGAKARQRLAAKRTKPKTDNRFRTEASNLKENRDVNAKSPRIATSPGVKRPPGSPKRGTNRPKQLTARERQRALLVKNRDIGAKAAARKTPKSTADTVKQASGPAQKGQDIPLKGEWSLNSDPSRSQRNGVVSGRKNPQPKGTNPRQAPSGRGTTSAEEKARTALKNYDVEGRVVKSNERFSARNTPNMTKPERDKARRAAEKEIRAKAKGLRAQVKDKVGRQREAARNNQAPGKSDRSDQSLGRDWRNRLSNDRARQHSEHMTRIRSGKSVRTNGELVQSPKGKGRRADPRDMPGGKKPYNDGRQSEAYRSDTTTRGIKPSNRSGLKTADRNTPTVTNQGKGRFGGTETSVSRPRSDKPRTAEPKKRINGKEAERADIARGGPGKVTGKPSPQQTVKYEQRRLKEKEANRRLAEKNARNKPTKQAQKLRPAKVRRNVDLNRRMKEADTQSQFHSNF